MRFSTGAICSVTVPATIIRSLCRGLGRKTSAPKRAMSKREVLAAIISMAQHARPKVSGQMDDSRALVAGIHEELEIVRRAEPRGGREIADHLVAPRPGERILQIGRASCRERV